MKRLKHSLIASAVAAASITSTAVNADMMLEEIVVTAQKRAQTLQEVPVAVSVINNDFIAQENIVGLQGLADKVPNLTISKTPFQPTVNIRGMGTGGGARAFEQSVAMYVDGVYAGRANQFLNPFFDVERVEVVRGPQTVLFGVNAIAGGINIINVEPGNELEGFVSGGYGLENETWHTDAAVTLPVSEDLSIRLSGRKGVDGQYLENTLTGEDNPKNEYDMFRASARWAASEDVTVKLSADTSSFKENDTGIQLYYVNPFGVFTNAIPGVSQPDFLAILGEDAVLDNKRTGAPNTAEFTNIDADNLTLNVEWAVGDLTLTSVTGYSQYEFAQAVPAASIPLDLGVAAAEEDFDQVYQELRLTSPGGETIDYIAGLVYFKQNMDIYQGIDIALAPGLDGAIRNGLQQETETAAAFAQLTYNISDSFRAVLGLRYSNVEKTASFQMAGAAHGSPLSGYTNDPATYGFIRNVVGIPDWFVWYDNTATLDPTAKSFSRKRSLDGVDPSLSLQWDINDSTGAYFTYAEGTKAGGFNDQEKAGTVPELGFTTDSFEYENEEATNYEIGVKMSQASWRANVALFHTEFKNLQVSQSNGNNVFVDNASSVTSDGLEFDGVVLVTENIEIGGNLALLDSTYDSFPGVACPFLEDARNPLATSATCDNLGILAPANNVDGKQTELSPEITGSAYVQWNGAVSNALELTVKATAYYNDGYTLASDYDPIDSVDSFWKYDLYAELASLAGNWKVSVLGKNLTDEIVLGQGGDSGLGVGHQGMTLPGRQVLLNATWMF